MTDLVPSDSGAGLPELSRRGFLVAGGGAALAFLLAGCVSGNPSSNSSTGASGSGGTAGASSDTIRFAVASYPGSWDEDFVGFDVVALSLYKNIYPYMIDYGVTTADGARIQDTSKIGPTFAESFTPDATGKVWTLKLRNGVKFPSGNPMTAADVKWSKDRSFAAQSNVAGIYRLIGLTTPDQIKVVDDYTVEFHQAFPSALTQQIQAICLFIYDSKDLKKHATSGDPWAKDWVAKHPQAGGYYNVASATQGQEIVLQANPNYPGPEAPKTATIRLPVVSSAADMRLQLQNGDIDVAMGLSRRDIADLKNDPDVDIISSASNEMVVIQMSVTTAPFNDPRVRQALAYAIPYDQIIKNVYNGDARPVKSPVPLEMPGYIDTGYPYDYDQAKAKQLLAQAGHSSLSTELVYASGDAEQEQLAVLIGSQLKAVGVTLKLSPLDPATLASRRESKNIPMQITYGQQWVNDVEYLLSTSLTKGAALNYSNYSNPQIESIFAKSHTITDQAQRIKLWAQVQHILARDVPWLVICQPNFNLPVRKGISGWVQPVDSLFRLRYMTKS